MAATAVLASTSPTGTVGRGQPVTVSLDAPGHALVRLQSAQGLFSSEFVPFSGDAGPKQVTFTPHVAGTAVIEVSNDVHLDNPTPLVVTVASSATTYGMLADPTGLVGIDQPIAVFLNAPGDVRVILSADSDVGIVDVPVLHFTGTAGPLFTGFTPFKNGVAQILATNDGGLIDPAPLKISISGGVPDVVAGATTYTITTAPNGIVGRAQNVLVELDQADTTSITLTADDVLATFSSSSVSFTDQAGPKAVLFTPGTATTIALSGTDVGTLVNPPAALIHAHADTGAIPADLVLSGMTFADIVLAGTYQLALTSLAELTVTPALLDPDPTAAVYALDVGMYAVHATWRSGADPILIAMPLAGAGLRALQLSGTTYIEVTAADTYALSLDGATLLAVATVATADGVTVFDFLVGNYKIRVIWDAGTTPVFMATAL